MVRTKTLIAAVALGIVIILFGGLTAILSVYEATRGDLFMSYTDGFISAGALVVGVALVYYSIRLWKVSRVPN